MIIRLTASCNNRCAFCLVDDECRLFAHRRAAERLAHIANERLSIRTSVLGHNATLHDRLNGVRGGAFRQTLAGIANLTKLGFGVQTNVVIMAENIEHLLGCVMAAVSAGSRSIKLSGLVRTARVVASIPDPEQVRERLKGLVSLLLKMGLSVRLEKLTPCVVPDHLDVLRRESDPSPESARWFVKTEQCQSCALVSTCDGAECGAVARYGDTWLKPFTAVRDNLITRIPADKLDRFISGETRSVIKVELPSDPNAALGFIPAIARFRARHPQLFLLA